MRQGLMQGCCKRRPMGDFHIARKPNGGPAMAKARNARNAGLLARALTGIALALVSHGAFAAGPEGTLGYYRFPSIRHGRVVFTAEGDLWRVPLAGGLARRL